MNTCPFFSEQSSFSSDTITENVLSILASDAELLAE